MRKFLAVLWAIILAVALVLGISAYKRGFSLKDINLNNLKQMVMSRFQKTPVSAESVPAALTQGENAGAPLIPHVADAADSTVTYQDRIQKGDYFFDRGFLTYAANEYVRAANMQPNSIEPYLRLLKTNFELGEYDKAILNAKTILNGDPQNVEAQLGLAQVHIKQSEFDEAEKALTNLESSTDPRVLYTRAMLRIVKGDNDTAKKLLADAKARAMDPELSGNIDQLLKAYDEFDFAQAADDLYLSELLARGLNQAGEYELAIAKLKDILKARSDLRDSWVMLGFAYLNLEKYYFSVSAFEKAYEIDPSWPPTQYFLGEAHAALKENDDAILYYNYAFKNGFEPKVVVLQKLADLYLATQKYPDAVKTYRDILDLNRQDVGSFVRPVWIYIDYLNQPEEALKLANLAVMTFPQSAMAYNLLGWSQTGTKDTANAEKNLKKALELDPKLAAAYLNLGKLYEVTGNKEDAITNYQQAYDLDQNGSIGRLAAQRYDELIK